MGALEGKELCKALVSSRLGFGICPVGTGKEEKENHVIYLATASCGVLRGRGGDGGFFWTPSLLPMTLAFVEASLRMSIF